jgi:hypothetical protein
VKTIPANPVSASTKPAPLVPSSALPEAAEKSASELLRLESLLWLLPTGSSYPIPPIPRMHDRPPAASVPGSVILRATSFPYTDIGSSAQQLTVS